MIIKCKVLEKIIQEHVSHYCEEIKCLPESQNGFRRDRSAVDSIFVSKLVIFYARDHGFNMYKCFIDLEKAYDIVNRDILWLSLLRLGIKGLLRGSKAGIRIKGDTVANFALDTGLRQGSVFSPLQFDVYFGAIVDAWRARLKDMGIELRFKIGSDIFDVKALKKKAKTECMTLS